jgi:NADPH:quinone reductase-like Zn-dependent oxidoreductase
MAALGVSEVVAKAAIDAVGGVIELAAINAPRAVTVAGEAAALQTLQDRLIADGRSARFLKLNYPFHSEAMDPIRDELLARLEGLAPRTAEVPFISTVTGGALSGAELDPEYWWRNIRQKVRFADAVNHALRDGFTVFIEIGPQPVLCNYILQCAKASEISITALPTLRRPAPDQPEAEDEAVWQTICACHARGVGHVETLFRHPRGPVVLPPTRAAAPLTWEPPGKLTAYRLRPVAGGGTEAFAWRERERTPPGPGEVEIRVHAAGLNMRDVWCAAAAAAAPLGVECSGQVVAIGPDVTDFTPGDRVVGFASATFASHAIARADAICAIPGALNYAEAATIPIAFVTAGYALDHLARLRPGERALIHGAAGGVGLAAVQLARLRGAVVLATAGSAAKRCLLRRLGADHALRDHAPDFVDAVMQLTENQGGPRGVDVVLSALAGAAIGANLQTLRPFGRYLEVGRHDPYAENTIGQRPFRTNLSYFGIDADGLVRERPDLAGRIFADIMELFAAGDLRPLPYTTVPVTRAAEAFRRLQRYRPLGKIVLTMAPERAGRSFAPERVSGAVEIAAE